MSTAECGAQTNKANEINRESKKEVNIFILTSEWLLFLTFIFALLFKHQCFKVVHDGVSVNVYHL